MAASMTSEPPIQGNDDVQRKSPPRVRPIRVDSSLFGRPGDHLNFIGDGLVGQAEDKHAKDEVGSLKQYIARLQGELDKKRTLEIKVQSLEQDLKQERLLRGELQLRLENENLKERKLQEEIALLRDEGREADLKVLMGGKLDQLAKEKEVLLADLRHQQVRHREESQGMVKHIAQLQREKDELRIDLRLEADKVSQTKSTNKRETLIRVFPSPWNYVCFQFLKRTQSRPVSIIASWDQNVTVVILFHRSELCCKSDIRNIMSKLQRL